MSGFTTAGVIGAGAWGTALAEVCARAGLKAVIWAREPEVRASIAERHENALFLPGVILSDHVSATGDFAALAGCDSSWPRRRPSICAYLTPFAYYAPQGLPVVLCAKGVEQGSLKLMTEVMAECLPQARPAVLSGPSFAADVARGLPTAVTLACGEAAWARPWPRPSPSRPSVPIARRHTGAEAAGRSRTCWPLPAAWSRGGTGRSAPPP